LVQSFNFNLNRKLLVLVWSASLASIAVITFLSFNFADSILKEDVQYQLEEQSTERGQKIRELFNDKKQQVANLAQNLEIQKLFVELNKIADEQTLNSKLEEIQVLLTLKIRNFQLTQWQTFRLEDLQILDQNGRLLYSLNVPQENEKLFDEQKFPPNNKPKISFVMADSNDQRHMVISLPIFVSEQNSAKYVGSIVVTTNNDELDGILSNRQGLETTGEIYLVNEERFMVTNSIFVENAPLNQFVDTLPVSECFNNNKSLSGIYKDYRGVKILGISFCDIPNGFVLLTEMDEKEVLKPLFDLQQKIIIVGILFIIAVSSVTFFLSRRLSEPIKKLSNAAKEIANGNFNVQTNIKTRDEIGYLSTSFDTMAKKLQESQIAINLRDEIIKQQEDILLRFSQTNEECCVCIIDIIQSTMLTATLSVEKTKNFYEIFINSIAEIVKKFNGRVVKNIGDSLLFYFAKMDFNNKDYFKNVIDCCLTISDSNSEINEKMSKEGLPGIAYRTSITYGIVSIAKIATSSVDDIFGSTVNRCSKINRFALPNGVIIGSDVYERVKNYREYEFRNMNATVGTQSFYSVFLVTRK